MRLTAVLTPAAEGGYCAFNPETDCVSEGDTVDEAVANLREAVELYLEEFPFTLPAARVASLVTTFDVADA